MVEKENIQIDCRQEVPDYAIRRLAELFYAKIKQETPPHICKTKENPYDKDKEVAK